jgi:dTDP-4-dehydrorhamnose 3,5-epimerase
MQIITTELEGLYIIQPKCFEDARGYFFESYNENEFKKAGLHLNFVQDNQSLSQKGVLRGLHFQHPPHAQGKLVRVIKGAVLDVVIDIRKKSPTFGKYFALELNEQNKTMLYVPEGFAHGFLTLEDNTIFFYKCTNFYNKAAEDCILWNDPALNINWNISNPLVSEKDSLAKPLSEINILF